MSLPHGKIQPDKISPYEDVATRAANGLSRRHLFRALIGSAAVLSTGVALGLPERAEAKTAKKVAKYQDHPNKGKECSKCRFFLKPHSCQLVAGNISPNGWCSFFAAKTA